MLAHSGIWGIFHFTFMKVVQQSSGASTAEYNIFVFIKDLCVLQNYNRMLSKHPAADFLSVIYLHPISKLRDLVVMACLDVKLLSIKLERLEFVKLYLF